MTIKETLEERVNEASQDRDAVLAEVNREIHLVEARLKDLCAMRARLQKETPSYWPNYSPQIIINPPSVKPFWYGNSIYTSYSSPYQSLNDQINTEGSTYPLRLNS